MEEIRLRRERDWVRAQIGNRIAIGSDLIEAAGRVTDAGGLAECRNGYYSWDEYNATLLETSFEGPITDAYTARGPRLWVGGIPLREQVASLERDIATKNRRLASIRDRLDLYDAPTLPQTPVLAQIAPAAPMAPSTAFLVHGHAEGSKHEVARWLEHVGITPVILHEQPNSGRTIIEKFEEEAGGVGYAVVLATGDDEGRRKGESEFRPRPRQNVVLELGFFVGKLGRDRVAVLREPDVELPSDYDGVVYIELDAAGGWKLKLAQELKTAGLEVDDSKLSAS